jgi:ribosomal protein L11 methylase PrmA
LLAYLPEEKFSVEDIDLLLQDFFLDAEIAYSYNVIEDKNWNEEWEKHYFQPIVFEDKCIIHSSFHHPEGSYRYRILIDPKMAFGRTPPNDRVDIARDPVDGSAEEIGTRYGLRHSGAGHIGLHVRCRSPARHRRG